MRAPSLRLAMLIVALVAFGAAAAGVGVRAAYGERTTADEPHYLVTAISIWSDGDLDVYDEFLHRDYAPFNGLILPAPGRPDARRPADRAARPAAAGAAGRPDGARRLGGREAHALPDRRGARRPDAVDRRAPLRRARCSPAPAVVGLLAATVPLAAYGSQVYPEIAGALCATGAVAALTGPMRRGGLVALALCLVALPWLSIKYVPVAAALAAVALWRLLRDRRVAPPPPLAGALAACAVAFVAVHVTVYGGVTAYAAGSHFVDGQLTVVGDDPDYFGRSRRLVGLLVDRDFGIGAWQPLWLLLVPAVAALLARRPRGTAALLLPLAAGWFVATFLALTMQGWWFPGRQLVVVLPLAAIAIAWWVRAGGRAAGRGRGARRGRRGGPGVHRHRGAARADRVGGRPPDDRRPAVPRDPVGHPGVPGRGRRHLAAPLGLDRRPRRAAVWAWRGERRQVATTPRPVPRGPLRGTLPQTRDAA